MGNNVLKMEKYWFLGLLVALAVFCSGLFFWISAFRYTPVTPPPTPVNKYSFAQKGKNIPLSKYQNLLGGKLFFDETQVLSGGFRSKLVLWGLIHGSLAIVGTDPQSNQNTWMVKAGDEVEGEKVVSVNNDHIMVRNPTGQGKVFLRD